MKDETKKFMDEYVEKMYPLLELLDIHNLNTEQLIATPTGEELTDGKVYFKVERRLTNELKKILTEEIMSEYGEDEVVYDSDTYYMVYDSCDKLSCGSNPKEKGGIVGFAIERNGTMYFNDIVGDLLFCMSESSDIKQIKRRLHKCADDYYNVILNQLRKLVPVNGSFLEDALKENLYIHRRAVGDDKHQDYIINNWQNFLSERKDIKWINFWETDNMFIALE
jgi:MoaA/NifB/PqqE/SkfB family radical SAM enzyme